MGLGRKVRSGREHRRVLAITPPRAGLSNFSQFGIARVAVGAGPRVPLKRWTLS